MTEKTKDKLQGEGDYESGRRYDEHTRQFVRDGKVDKAAKQAEEFVESDPAEAASAEKEARRRSEAVPPKP